MTFGKQSPSAALVQVLWYLVVLANVCNASLFGSRSTIEEYGHGISRYDNVEGISDLLVARTHPQSDTLSNAKRIIRGLSTSSTCSHAATVRLLQACKAIEPKHHNSNADHLLENARSSYAISMSLCAQRQARVEIPPSCQPFDMDLNRDVSTGTVQVFRQYEIELCSNKMYNTPSWTDVTVYKTQSKDLCDASRLDLQREELLEEFRKATSIIPEIIVALQNHHEASSDIMANMRDSAADVLASHLQAASLAEEQALLSKQHMQRLSDFITAHIRSLDNAEGSLQAAIAQGFKQASHELAVVQSQASHVGHNLADIYAAAAEAVSSMSLEFGSGLDVMSQQVNDITSAVVDLATAGHLKAIEDSMSQGRAAADEYATVQASQVETAHHQLSLSQRVLETIEHSHGRLEEIQKAVDLLPASWFGALHHIQDHVQRLRHEVKCILIFVIPAFFLLLFGRFKAACCTVLLYVFARTLWSCSRQLDGIAALLSLYKEDVRLALLCMAIAFTMGAAFALIREVFRDLAAGRQRRARHRRVLTARFDEVKFKTLSSLPNARNTAPRDRYERAKSVPIDMA